MNTSSSSSSSNTIPRSYSMNSFKRFHTKDLGIPPSQNNHVHINPIERPTKLNNKSIKIAPMKEVEKMITDLKKENFDLKLRLYHLEEMMKEKRIHLKPKTCSIGTQTNALFESTPEAFGLSSIKKTKQNIKDENITSVVMALENIKIENNSNNWLSQNEKLTFQLF